MLQIVMSKLSLKVYLVCGYAILALLFLPAPVFATTSCVKNPQTCSDQAVCIYATDVRAGTKHWSKGQWISHVKEADRRGLSCSVYTPNPSYFLVESAYNGFMNLSDEERKDLQSKLKEINLYGSGIDGLYGKGTQTSL